MPLVNNKVGDDHTVGTDKALADGKALVDSLIKVSCSKYNQFVLCCGLVVLCSYIYYSRHLIDY